MKAEENADIKSNSKTDQLRGEQCSLTDHCSTDFNIGHGGRRK